MSRRRRRNRRCRNPGCRDSRASASRQRVTPRLFPTRRGGRNWHLSRERVSLAWLPWRHRACPSATLDEARPYSVVWCDCIKRSDMQIEHMHTSIMPSTRRPSLPARTRRLGQVDEVVPARRPPRSGAPDRASSAVTRSTSTRCEERRSPTRRPCLLARRRARSAARRLGNPPRRNLRGQPAEASRRASVGAAADHHEVLRHRRDRRAAARCPGTRSWRCGAGRSRSGSR